MNTTHVALGINMDSVSSPSWLGHHHNLILSILLFKKKTVLHGAVQILNSNRLFGALMLWNRDEFHHIFIIFLSVWTKPNNFFKNKITRTHGTLLAASCNTEMLQEGLQLIFSQLDTLGIPDNLFINNRLSGFFILFIYGQISTENILGLDY